MEGRISSSTSNDINLDGSHHHGYEGGGGPTTGSGSSVVVVAGPESGPDPAVVAGSESHPRTVSRPTVVVDRVSRPTVVADRVSRPTVVAGPEGAGQTESPPTDPFTFRELAQFAACSAGCSSVLLGILQLIREAGNKPTQKHHNLCLTLVALIIAMMITMSLAALIHVIPCEVPKIIFTLTKFFIIGVAVACCVLLALLAF